MRTQRYPFYNPIARWGCYFLSLASIAEKVTGRLLTDEQVRMAYIDAVTHASMKNNCFVTDPAYILNLFLGYLDSGKYRAMYIGWWNRDTGLQMFGKWSERDTTHEVIRRECKTGYHFTTVDYDPDPNLNCGPLNGRRLFKIRKEVR